MGMFRCAIVRRSEHRRPFWLTVALSIMLLVSVSITIAHAAHPARLADHLRRDLAALRAQLELIDPWQPDTGRQTVAFNTDLGDGGPAFQRHSMVTIAGAAARRLERLLDGYREQGNDARLRTAEPLRLTMRDLQHQIDRLARAADPAEAAAARERIVALLERAEPELALVLDGARQPALPEAAGRDATAADGAR
jgi:hypothetical protein